MNHLGFAVTVAGIALAFGVMIATAHTLAGALAWPWSWLAPLAAIIILAPGGLSALGWASKIWKV